MKLRTIIATVGAVAIACSLAACSSSNPGSGTTEITTEPSSAFPTPYPAPKDPMALARAAGLVPETAEQLQYHVHAHLDVYVDGLRILVPAGLGIDITNPGVHQGTTDGAPAYGGIVVPCATPCISPLHTHDISGIIHTESSTHKDNTLGQLFIEWNVKFSDDCFATFCQPHKAVAVFVNGTKSQGDPGRSRSPITRRSRSSWARRHFRSRTGADWSQI